MNIYYMKKIFTCEDFNNQDELTTEETLKVDKTVVGFDELV